MRFMMIVKSNKESEAGALPSRELIAAMGNFNEEMAKAGVLLFAEGLQGSNKGIRITFSEDGKRTVTDGPFAETKELIAGFWIIKVKSREEAVQWALRSPAPHGDGHPGQIELRQIFEAEDFPSDVLPPEELAREKALRASLAK